MEGLFKDVVDFESNCSLVDHWSLPTVVQRRLEAF